MRPSRGAATFSRVSDDATNATLVCPQCSLEVQGLERCPECGTPCVPESALRLSPGPEGDESAYSEVVVLGDPFEGQHLVALLETRRIPVMIRGGTEAALSAGWVDHSHARFGVLMVPEGRLAEAKDLVEQFRAEMERAGPLDEEELAAVAEAAGKQSGSAANPGQTQSAPPAELTLGGLHFAPLGRIGLGILGLVGMAVALRARRLLIALVLLGWGLYSLSNIETEVVLEGARRRVRIWKPLHRLIGRAPQLRPFAAFEAVTVTLSRGRYRVTLRPQAEGVTKAKRKRLEVHGPSHRSLPAAIASAQRAATYLALPFEPPAGWTLPKPPGKDSRS